METTLRVLGDGVTIATLSIMCSISLMVWKRVPPGVRVPMQWSLSGKVAWRAHRSIAVSFVPVLSAVLLLGFTAFGMTRQVADSNQAIILFFVRMLVAGFLALAHLAHLRWAMKTMIEDGDIPG